MFKHGNGELYVYGELCDGVLCVDELHYIYSELYDIDEWYGVEI